MGYFNVVERLKRKEQEIEPNAKRASIGFQLKTSLKQESLLEQFDGLRKIKKFLKILFFTFIFFFLRKNKNKIQ